MVATDTTGAELWRARLAAARWFQGKGLPLGELEVRPQPWYTTDGDVWVRSEVAIATVGDDTQTYHLLVGYLPVGAGEPAARVGTLDLPGRGPVDVVDAPASPRAMTALLRALRTPGAVGMRWLGTPPDPAHPTQVFTGEQSNTTVRCGDAILFKIFRKLSPGPNLEAQVLSALTGSGITPRLVGTLTTPDGAYDLGLFAQRIPDARDGWAYCVEACRDGRLVDDEMRRLGTTLGRLHIDLAEIFGTSTVDAQVIAQAMLDRLDAACASVHAGDDLCEPVRSSLHLTGDPVPVQRVHGDFHLGQALIRPGGWTIIDFEGEPLKTPAERVASDSVWRDVAGLLRSLDYARHHHPDPDGAAAIAWHRAARAAFLDGYLDGAPCPRQLLTAYEIDKAVYELVYETRNRPDWVAIPRQALLEATAHAG